MDRPQEVGRVAGHPGVVALDLDRHRNGPADTWSVELLDEMPTAERPAPFTEQRHFFKSRPAALEWLGIRKERVPDAPTG
jgi:hypothetical protein